MRALGPGLVVLISLFSTGVVRGQISGSPHDFSGAAWSASEICRPCHTPHNADISIVSAPLWNHRLSTATYSIYTSATLMGAIGQPGPMSQLCLSCHDGTVAIDAYGGSIGGQLIPPAASVGTDLRDDHPVGVTWDHRVANGGGCTQCHDLHDPSVTYKDGVRFFEGKVECATCHDVHNTAGFAHLLVKTMDASALCQHCHLK